MHRTLSLNSNTSRSRIFDRQTSRSRHGRPSPWRSGAVLVATLELIVLLIFLGSSLLAITYHWKSVQSENGTLQNIEPAFRITAISDDRSVWVQRGFQRLENVDIQTGAVSSLFPEDVSSLTETRISRDGETVVIVIDDQNFHVFRRQQLLLVDPNPASLFSLSALSANGRVAVRVIDGTLVRAWEIEDNDAQPFDSSLKEEAERIALDDTGDRLLVFSKSGTLSLHETRTGRLLMSLPPFEAHPRLTADPEFTPDGTGLVVACGHSIVCYELTHGTIAWSSTAQSDSLGYNHLSISADGRRIAAGGIVAGVCLLNLVTGKIERQILDPNSSNRVELSPSGDRLYCGWRDGSIKVFSIPTDQSAGTLHKITL